MTTAEVTTTLNSFASRLAQIEPVRANFKEIYNLGMDASRFFKTVSGQERRETIQASIALTDRFFAAIRKCLD